MVPIVSLTGLPTLNVRVRAYFGNLMTLILKRGAVKRGGATMRRESPTGRQQPRLHGVHERQATTYRGARTCS